MLPFVFWVAVYIFC